MKKYITVIILENRLKTSILINIVQNIYQNVYQIFEHFDPKNSRFKKSERSDDFILFSQTIYIFENRGLSISFFLFIFTQTLQ